MEIRNLLNKVLPLLVIIGLAALSRIVPHIANITPIAGIALFSGTYFNKKMMFILPLAAMILSDMFLGFHSTMLYVYGSFIAITLLGKVIHKDVNVVNLLSLTILSSLLFYFVTNFGVWAQGQIYSKDIAGLFNCYVMGLPFLKNTLIGDLFYTFTLFYGFKYYNKWVTSFDKKLVFTK